MCACGCLCVVVCFLCLFGLVCVCLCLLEFVCVIDTLRKVESKEGNWREELAGRKRRPLILSFASPPLHTNTQMHTNTPLHTTQHNTNAQILHTHLPLNTTLYHNTAMYSSNHPSVRYIALILSSPLHSLGTSCTTHCNMLHVIRRGHLHDCFHAFHSEIPPT